MTDRFWLWIGFLAYAEAWLLGLFSPGWGIVMGAFALGAWLWGLRDSGR